MKKLLSIGLVAIFLLLLIGNITFAQGGLVPCGGPDNPCTLCHFLVLIKNVVELLTQIGVVLAGLFFAWGAFRMMTAGGSPEGVAAGKKAMTTVIIGLLIMFSAYLIVGTTLNILTDSPSKIPWTQIQCPVQ